MRILAVLVLTALLAGTFATSDEEAYNKLQKMETTKFGKNLLDMIALQMKTSDQVEDLIDLLQEIEEKLENEQKEDDVFIRQFQTSCDEVLDKLAFEISEAKQKVATLQAEIDEKTPIRNQKAKESADKQEFRGLLQDKLVDLENRRVLKEEEWEQEQEEHDQASFVVEQARNIIQSALEESLVQKGGPRRSR